jgi:hypothetical protein
VPVPHWWVHMWTRVLCLWAATRMLQVRYALSEMSRALADNKEGAYDMFLSFDSDGDGKLDHKGVVDLARRLAPDLRPREVRSPGGLSSALFQV